jgi:GT2 family glycosyltransferase
VKFLDSDDFLETKSIARQCACLENSGADICYSDWRMAFGAPDATQVRLGPVERPGQKVSPLDDLLEGWWCPFHAYLFRRSVIAATEGFDESLTQSNEDFEFMARLLARGARAEYEAGLCAIYVRHPHESMTQTHKPQWCEGWIAALDSISRLLENADLLTGRRREALCKAYLQAGKCLFRFDRKRFDYCLGRMRAIKPDYKPPGWLYRTMVGTCGYRFCENILEVRRTLRRIARGTS